MKKKKIYIRGCYYSTRVTLRVSVPPAGAHLGSARLPNRRHRRRNSRTRPAPLRPSLSRPPADAHRSRSKTRPSAISSRPANAAVPPDSPTSASTAGGPYGVTVRRAGGRGASRHGRGLNVPASMLRSRRPRATIAAPAAHHDHPQQPTTATTNEPLPPNASLAPSRACVSSLCDSNFADDVAVRRGPWRRSMTRDS